MENYFNYFTEIEEQFRKCRGQAVLLSPLDWALIESWRDQGFPLEAVLAGIERAFKKFKNRKRTYRKVNSLSYCSQEVYRAVEESHAAAAQEGSAHAAKPDEPAPFSAQEVAHFLSRCAAVVESAGKQASEDGKRVLAEELKEIVNALQALGTQAQAQPNVDLEEMERTLTALEEKLNASLQRGTAVEVLAQLRAEVDRGLIPYRRKMAGPEVESLERRFLKNRLLENYNIPRLSLFYL